MLPRCEPMADFRRCRVPGQCCPQLQAVVLSSLPRAPISTFLASSYTPKRFRARHLVVFLAAPPSRAANPFDGANIHMLCVLVCKCATGPALLEKHRHDFLPRSLGTPGSMPSLSVRRERLAHGRRRGHASVTPLSTPRVYALSLCFPVILRCQQR